MKNIKLIIFDLDGTLIDAYPAINSSFNYCMQKFGFPRQPLKVIRRAVGWGDRNLLMPFLAKSDLAKAVKIYRHHHREALLKKSHLFKGVKHLLTYFKNKGLKLAVASNRPQEFSLILIRHLKLNKYFDFVLCADKLKKGKPDPEILKKIMLRLKTKPGETVYVGDMIIDVQAGRRAKVTTIAVTTGSSTREELLREEPSRVLKRATDLEKIF